MRGYPFLVHHRSTDIGHVSMPLAFLGSMLPSVQYFYEKFVNATTPPMRPFHLGP